MSERALVVAGGGSAGNAWAIGVIAGLADAGLDVTRADLLVGTSAGATIAAQISSATPSQLLADIVSAEPRHQAPPGEGGSGRASMRPAPDHMERTSRIIASATDAPDMRRRMGAALREVDRGPDGSRRWRETVEARLPCRDWPERPLLITAVDAYSGEPVVFDRRSGVDLVDAVAASTAGGFAYTIGNKQYIGGGYRRNENADLAAGHARVLLLSPFGGQSRNPLEWGMHLSAQVDELRAGGSRVEPIFPDMDSQREMGAGMDVMDLSRRSPSARAGYRQGRALAAMLTEFWH